MNNGNDSNNNNRDNNNNSNGNSNDRGNHHGVFHDLLDGNPQQFGHTIRNFVRGFMNHVQQRSSSQAQSPPHRETRPTNIPRSSEPTNIPRTPSELDSFVAPSASQAQEIHPSTEQDRGIPQPESERSTRPGARRARVDDEDDEEVLRETNRQRMHPPQLHEDVREPTSPQAHVHHPTDNTNNAPDAPAAPPPAYSRIVYTFDFIPSPVDGVPVEPLHHAPHGADAQNPNDRGHRDAEHHGPLPRFNFSFNIPMAPPGPGVPPNGNAHPRNNPTPPHFAPFIDNFSQFLQARAGATDGPFVFGMPFHGLIPEDREDPERAKRLVGGLEEVPTGLLKRLERVSGDAPSCAVCWDKLLEGASSDGDDRVNSEEPEAPGRVTEEVAMEVDDDSATASQSTSDTRASQSSPSPGDEPAASNSAADAQNKIVVLPCAHVFHASCLLPWFTQPHRTSCPSCRFDIDPESLTYVPRPPRSRRTPRRARPDGERQEPFRDQARPPAQAADGTAAAQPSEDASVRPGRDEHPIEEQEARNNGRDAGHGTRHLPPLVTFDLSMFIPMNGGPRPPQAPHTDQAQAQGNPTGQPPPLGTTGRVPQNGTFVPIDDNEARALATNVFEMLFGGLLVPMPPDGPVGAGGAGGAGATGMGAGPIPPLEFLAAGPRPFDGPGAAFGDLPDFMTTFGHIPRPTPRNHPATGTPPGPTPDAGTPSGTAGRVPPPPHPIHPRFFPDFFPIPRAPNARPAAAPQPGATQPGSQAHMGRPPIDEFDDFLEELAADGGFFGFPPMPPNAGPRPGGFAETRRRSGDSRPPEKRQWTLPPPPGPTLRQRVETKEHELGFRCCDISCGLGPSDEDPNPAIDGSTVHQIHIRPLNDADADKVCEHTFHPACLVSAERVAGWGSEDNKEEKEGEQVEVSCPVCRAVGCVLRETWDEGACALA